MTAPAWVAWVVLVMAVALTSTNPLYLSLALLCVVLVGVLAPRTTTAVAGFRALLVLGLGLFAVSLGIAVINGNYGGGVLFTVPGPDLPKWLGGLALGGPVTAEGLVAAAIRGTAVLTILLAFAVFNGAVSPHRVLRTTPAALFHAGLIVTIGLALLPATIEDIRRLREIRALRGRGGLRDLPGLVVPAVLGGLERSMRLAEAMEARGYGNVPRLAASSRLAGLAGPPLLFAGAACWYYAGWMRPAGLSLAGAGVILLVAWFVAAARRRKATRLHDDSLPLAEKLLASISAGAAALMVAGDIAGWLELDYNPFVALSWPEFGLAGAALGLSCGWPAALLVGRGLFGVASAPPEVGRRRAEAS